MELSSLFSFSFLFLGQNGTYTGFCGVADGTQGLAWVRVKAVNKQLLLECWACVDRRAGFECLERSAIKRKLAQRPFEIASIIARFVPGCREAVAANNYLLASAAF